MTKSARTFFLCGMKPETGLVSDRAAGKAEELLPSATKGIVPARAFSTRDVTAAEAVIGHSYSRVPECVALMAGLAL